MRRRRSRSGIRRSRSPKLTPEIVADESPLAAAVDDLFVADPKMKKLTQTILRAASRLQDAVTSEQFQLYLDIEAAVNWRMNFMLIAVARWAFNEGRRHQRHVRKRRA